MIYLIIIIPILLITGLVTWDMTEQDSRDPEPMEICQVIVSFFIFLLFFPVTLLVFLMLIIDKYIKCDTI